MIKPVLFAREYSAAFGAALFLMFVVAGAAYIVSAKLAGLSPVAVTGVPLVLMILYALTLASTRYFKLRDDQAGDNLYYLGFLYTLSSLGIALWQFSVDDGGENIVTNFGIAISSTILGVALRVMFNQMRQDPMEVEQTARLELADAARRVKQEFDATVFEFASFRRASQQVLEEGLREKRELSERLAKEIFEAIKEFPARSSEPLQLASEQSKEKINNLASALASRLEITGNNLAAQEEKLASIADTVTASLEEVQSRLRSMQTPDGIIEIKLQPFIRGFTKAIKEQSASTESQTAELQRVISQFDQSVTQLSQFLSADAQDRASHEKLMRDVMSRTESATAENKRISANLDDRLSAIQAAIPERVEPVRGWFRGGGS